MDNPTPNKSTEFRKPLNKKAILIIILFASLIIFILYTSLSEKTSLTENVIKIPTKNSPQKNPIEIEASLSVPTLELKGSYSKVELTGSSASSLHIGDQKSSLKNSRENKIILENYEGKISIDESGLLSLEGKTSEVTTNNIALAPNSAPTTKVSLEKFNYQSLKITDPVSIKELDYKTHGKININKKTQINIDNERVIIKKFQGNLEISDRKLKLNGHLQSLDIKGKQDISIK